MSGNATISISNSQMLKGGILRVGILGAGAIAYAAAYLAQSGHYPTLWSPSGKQRAELAAGQPLNATGPSEEDLSHVLHLLASMPSPMQTWSCLHCRRMFANFSLEAAAPHVHVSKKIGGGVCDSIIDIDTFASHLQPANLRRPGRKSPTFSIKVSLNGLPT